MRDAAEDVVWIDDKCPTGKHKGGGRAGQGGGGDMCRVNVEQQRWSM